jgi:YD repeat-containing protein
MLNIHGVNRWTLVAMLLIFLSVSDKVSGEDSTSGAPTSGANRKINTDVGEKSKDPDICSSEPTNPGTESACDECEKADRASVNPTDESSETKDAPKEDSKIKPTACPDALPAAMMPIKLAVIPCATAPGAEWLPKIQIGAGARLRYLDKVRLVLDAEHQRTVGDADWYKNAKALIGIVNMDDEVPDFFYNTSTDKWEPVGDSTWDGVTLTYTQCILRLDFPSGLYIIFEVSEGYLWGCDFRAIERGNLAGHKMNISYDLESATPTVTITDGSSQAHVCTLDGNGNITRIAVAGKNWDYTSTATSFTETTPTGLTRGYYYNAAGYIERWETWSGSSYYRQEYYYDAVTKRLTREVDSANDVSSRITTYDYDDDTGIITVIWPDGKISTKRRSGNTTYHANSLGAETMRNYSGIFMTSKTDTLGNVTSYAYDSLYRLTRKTTADDESIIYEYDNRNNLTRQQSPSRTSEYYYNGTCQLTRNVVNGQTTDYFLDADGLTTKVRDNLGKETLYEYNSQGKVTKTTSPMGFITYAAYDSWGNRTSVTDANGNTTHYYYDVANRLTRQVCPLGCDTSYTYNWRGQKTSQTDATSATTTWEYDGFGQVTRISGTGGGGGGCSSCGSASGAGGEPGDYAYNTVGRLTQFTDLNGHSTSYLYDAAWRKSKIIDARSYETVYSYDGDDKLTRVTDASLNHSDYAYDSMGRLTSVTTAAGTTSYAYDTAGRQTQVTDPAGGSRTTYYDSTGRVTRTEDALSRATDYAYDGAGNLTRTTQADSSTVSYSYDNDYRLTATTDQSGQTSFSYYDNGGRLTRSVDPLSHATNYFYDTGNRLTAVTDALGNSTSYGYDAVGRRTSVTDGAGRTVTTQYSARGWVTQTYDGVTTITYGYDEVGNRTSVTTSGGAE